MSGHPLHPAESALLQAQTAQLRGDISAANDWLDRAHRLAPFDKSIGLTRDLVRLSQEHGRDISAEIAAINQALAELLQSDRPADEPPRVPPGLPQRHPAFRQNEKPDPARPVAVVVPVYRNRAFTLQCLRAVFASVPDVPVIVVDDASPDPALVRDLNRWAAKGRVTLIRHASNQGFPVSANAGLRAVMAMPIMHDAVLLNADALVPRRRGLSWLARLRAVVHADGQIGSATPLSNNASLLSYPARDGDNPAITGRALNRLDALAARANPMAAAELPTGVGFCLYLRHEMLRDVGLLREDAFGLGYGEENDLCRRAAARGWVHVGCPGVFVTHHGAASFGTARTRLMARNIRVLEALHPGYADLVAGWAGRAPAEDNLARFRRNLDVGRWEKSANSAVLLITHASGGGVERSVQARAAAIAQSGRRAIILRPIPVPGDIEGAHLAGLCRVEDAARPEAFPNLVYRLPDEFPALLRLLRRAGPGAVEMHHRLGHAPEISSLARRLKVPLTIALHDCSALCPRVTLLGRQGRYCGEPTEIAACEACVATAGARNGEAISVSALRRRSGEEFARATAVNVPSSDMARRMRRYFPAMSPMICPPEDDRTIAPPPLPPRTAILRVAVIGALGIDKGLEVLLACARDAAERKLALNFRVIGHTDDDEALFATGHAFVTGQYAEAEAVALVRAQRPQLAFLPSVIPESWGYTLSIAWQAGLRCAVFDLGAQAERVRQTGFGWCLPLGLPAQIINNTLIACVNH